MPFAFVRKTMIEDLPEEINNAPQDRRAMFRLGFRRLMEPIAQYIEDRFDVSLPVDREVLRPPGAIEEGAFRETCYRCGNCVDVCPAKAIRSAPADDIERAGMPYVDPDLAACVVCDEFACSKACPSGALKPVDRAFDIRMGLAHVDSGLCLRQQGEDCRLCVAKCPLGHEAIRIGKGGQVEVTAAACVGCGVCQFYCPSLPKAIRIEPLG